MAIAWRRAPCPCVTRALGLWALHCRRAPGGCVIAGWATHASDRAGMRPLPASLRYSSLLKKFNLQAEAIREVVQTVNGEARGSSAN